MSNFGIMWNQSRRLAAACLAGGLLLAGNAAQADTLSLVSIGGPLGYAAQWAATSGSSTLPSNIAGDLNGSGDPLPVNNLTPNPAGSSYQFSDSYSGSTATSSAVTITPSGGSAEAIGFMDSFIIAVPTSTSNAFAFSLSLNSHSGLSNLSVRLYQYGSGTYPGLTAVNPNIVYTGSPGPNVVDPWSANTVAGATDQTSLPTVPLAAGEYVLQIAGLSNGSAGGIYNGQITVAPVPLPAPALLLLSGIAGLGVIARRRKIALP
jgi:hypothetical protein